MKFLIFLAITLIAFMQGAEALADTKLNVLQLWNPTQSTVPVDMPKNSDEMNLVDYQPRNSVYEGLDQESLLKLNTQLVADNIEIIFVPVPFVQALSHAELINFPTSGLSNKLISSMGSDVWSPTFCAAPQKGKGKIDVEDIFTANIAEANVQQWESTSFHSPCEQVAYGEASIGLSFGLDAANQSSRGGRLTFIPIDDANYLPFPTKRGADSAEAMEYIEAWYSDPSIFYKLMEGGNL